MTLALEALFRWLHIFVGIIWIGHLYFFNFVNGPFAATMDADTKKKVVPELMPRALFWFRYGAMWTWITGVLLLFIVYYHGSKQLAEDQAPTVVTWILVLVSFAAPFGYDALYKSELAKNPKAAHTVAFLVLAVLLFLMAHPSIGKMSYRGYLIHAGVILGTIMAFNVWFRIWPSQQKIITAVKAGQAPDKDVVALAGARSRHNTYMSVPLVWAMIGQHTVFFAGRNVAGINISGWVFFLIITLIGWHVVWQLYRKAGQVKGF